MSNYCQPFKYITLQVLKIVYKRAWHVLMRISMTVLLQTTHPHCKQHCYFMYVLRGQNASSQIVLFSFHTFLVEDSLEEQKLSQGQTTVLMHMHLIVSNSNIEIRIVGSSGRPQLLCLISFTYLLLCSTLLQCRPAGVSSRWALSFSGSACWRWILVGRKQS